MKLNENFSRFLGKTSLKLKEHAPKIMLVTGVVGIIGTVVLACSETLSAEVILDEHKNDLEKIKDTEILNKENEVKVYSPQQKQKDTVIVYARTAGKFAKLYAPAFLLGTVSIGLILKSNSILENRYLGIASAYMTLKEEYERYKNQVKKEIGSEKEEQVQINSVLDLDKDYSEEPLGVRLSGYAKIFDETNPNYTKSSDANNMFLRRQLHYLNDKLQAKGYLFLNDVYSALGFPPTKAGQVVGWILDNPKGNGYVDFGLDSHINTQKSAFINGYENAVILDFNVDGPILDLLKIEQF